MGNGVQKTEIDYIARQCRYLADEAIRHRKGNLPPENSKHYPAAERRRDDQIHELAEKIRALVESELDDMGDDEDDC